MKSPQQKRFAQFTGLLFLLVIHSDGSCETKSTNLTEKLVDATQISNNIGLEMQARKTVSPKNLTKSLSCIRGSVEGYLMPVYRKHINALFTEAEQKEALVFFESDAWKKSWAIQNAEMESMFVDKAGNVPPRPSLTIKEQDEMKRFSSSDLGGRFMTLVYSIAEDQELSAQLEIIKHNCIAIYESPTSSN